MPFHDDFLARLAARLDTRATQGLFSQAHLLDGSWNKCSWLHSRVWGAMVEAVPSEFCPMVDVKWDGAFKPDLCAVDRSDVTRAVVEYESTNSSDERVPLDKLVKFENRIGEYVGSAHQVPGTWLLLTSLPSQPVRNWPWHGWNTNLGSPPVPKSRPARNAGPLTYYQAGWTSAFQAAWGRLCVTFGGTPPLDLVWANLGADGIRILSLNGTPSQEPFFPVNLP